MEDINKNTLNIILCCPECGDTNFFRRGDSFECAACGTLVNTEEMCSTVVTVGDKKGENR